MGVRGAAAAAMVFSLAGLVACSSGDGSSGTGGGAVGGSAAPPSTQPSTPLASSAPASSPPSEATLLQTMTLPLGRIVVDGRLMTVYVYDKDKPNATKSSCTGSCASLWPEVTTASTSPSVTGITGKIGTITGVDGKTQVTLDGRPLYTFAQDSGPGETKGQGYGGVWWLVGPDGKKITKKPSASASSGDSGGYNY
jgi:predicted lipoprotein with Yx(FWY)xxD motif